MDRPSRGRLRSFTGTRRGGEVAPKPDPAAAVAPLPVSTLVCLSGPARIVQHRAPDVLGSPAASAMPRRSSCSAAMSNRAMAPTSPTRSGCCRWSGSSWPPARTGSLRGVDGVFPGRARGVLAPGDRHREIAFERGLHQRRLVAAGAADPAATDRDGPAQLLRPAGIKTVFLVSQAWHLPRAIWTFERAGLAALPLAGAADGVAAPARPRFSAEHRRAGATRTMRCTKLIGAAYYRLRH